jgi:nitroreductase
MDIIFNRRSIRKYKDKPVEKEKIDKLLKACYAGTLCSKSAAMGIYCCAG